jgi:hypothetical protein
MNQKILAQATAQAQQSDELQVIVDQILAYAPEFDLYYFSEWFAAQNGYNPSEWQIQEQLQWQLEEMRNPSW